MEERQDVARLLSFVHRDSVPYRVRLHRVHSLLNQALHLALFLRSYIIPRLPLMFLLLPLVHLIDLHLVAKHRLCWLSLWSGSLCGHFLS